MAGHALARLTDACVRAGNIVFSVAGRQDEPDIRRLLRENALGGAFEIALEREPDAFAGDFGLSASQVFIIARDSDSGEAIGLCERVVRAAYVDGEVGALPYIGALRVAASHRHKIGVLRGGFQALRRLAERPGELPFALTSITSDNSAAQRVLTAGLPGLPLYRPLGDFSTFALRPGRQRVPPGITAGSAGDLPALARFLQKINGRFQMAPVWTEAALRHVTAAGLLPEHFLIARDGGAIRGCLAVWDQSAWRQTIIRRYPPLLARLRPLANLAAPALNFPALPPPGAPLRQVFLSHVAVEDNDPRIFLALVAAGLDQAARRGFGVAVIGFASERPWRQTLRRARRTLEYRTSLYLAHWPEAAAQVAALHGGMAHPELGLL